MGVRKLGKGRESMWKYFAAAGMMVALAVPAVASAAVLEKGTGVGCPDGQVGTFEFTVNQTTSTEPGTVTAAFDSGEVWTSGAFEGTVTKKTRKYFINAHGKLLSASSSLDGKLVFDGFWCFPPA
jgi:hypothetical protein